MRPCCLRGARLMPKRQPPPLYLLEKATMKGKQLTSKDVLDMATIVYPLCGASDCRNLATSIRSAFDVGIKGLVIVDAGNNFDKVSSICQGLAFRQAVYFPVTVSDQNLSRASLLNFGSSRAKGEFLFLCDSDILFTHAAINAIAERFVNAKASLVCPPMFYASLRESEKIRRLPNRTAAVDWRKAESDPNVPSSEFPIQAPGGLFVVDRYSFYSAGGFDSTLRNSDLEQAELIARWKFQGRPCEVSQETVVRLFNQRQEFPQQKVRLSQEQRNGSLFRAFSAADIVDREEATTYVNGKQRYKPTNQGIVSSPQAPITSVTETPKRNRPDKPLIVICGETLGLGGAEKMTVDMANALHDGGFDVRVLLTIAMDGIFKEFLNRDIPIDFAPEGDAFVRKVVQDKPEAIIFNNCRLGSFVIPQITERHRPAYFGSLLHGYNEWTIRMIPPEVNGHLTDIMTISAEAANGIAKARPYWKNKVTVFENYVDTNKFKPIGRKPVDLSRLRWPADSLVFGYMGRFSGEKSLVVMADVFRRVYEEDKRARLLMIGGADPGVPQHSEYWNKNVSNFTSVVDDMNLTDAVHVTGIVPDPWNYTRLLDVFIMTSQFEGVPLAMLEAMAAGVPCVSTAVGKIPQLLDCGAGYAIPKKGLDLDETEREQFAKRMLMVARKGERKEMGLKGREFAVRFHSLERYRKEIAEYFMKRLGCENGTAWDSRKSQAAALTA